MKKIKYIIWILVFSVWLLFTSFSSAQIFWDDEEPPINQWQTYFQWNVISSANWAKLTFSNSALAEGIWTPIFTWGANLINLMIKFFPILLLIAFFWICIWALHNLWKIKKDKNDKSLDNK